MNYPTGQQANPQIYIGSSNPNLNISGGSIGIAGRGSELTIATPRAIPSALEEIDRLLSQMDHNLDQLAARMEPALTPSLPKDKMPERPPGATKFGESLLGFSDRLHRFNALIGDLESRLQL